MALELGELSVDVLSKELHCNEKIALENKLRYQDFFNREALLPALLAYYGQAYKCLKAQQYSPDDFRFADDHLWITSFLYGLLRPLDLIHPYRLEGKAKLMQNDGKNMFAYWKPLLTDMLINAVQDDDGVLVHLATAEFQQLFDFGADLFFGRAFGLGQYGQTESDVVKHVHVAEEGVVLEHETDFALAHMLGGYVLAVKENLAAVGVFQSGDDAQERGFAAAGRAEQGNEFAGGDVEVDVFQRVETAEVFV